MTIIAAYGELNAGASNTGSDGTSAILNNHEINRLKSRLFPNLDARWLEKQPFEKRKGYMLMT